MAAARRRNATRANSLVRGETLVHRLFLLRWLHAEFGFRTIASDLRGDEATRKVLEAFRDTREGFGADGLSHVASRLLTQGGRHVSDSDLRRYDENICGHLHAINDHRAEPITLRYFQHLGLLYTERVLDRLFAGPAQLCAELNIFVRETKPFGWRSFPPFICAGPEFDDSGKRIGVLLDKLAFMMATGSGKTLLLHFNYRQFLHYNGNRPLANILMVTPGKDLSAQHERELLASGLPCRRFEAGRPRELMDDPRTIEIIEISRFVPQKKDKGNRVEPAQFSGRNLVFVDEGHRSKSEEGVQRRIRDELVGTDGFAFEYSATFQQAFAGDDDDQKARRDEYGAAISFDYSYRWFLHDGFGKDFTVLNTGGTDEEAGTWSLLAGLFVFAAQVHAFRSNKTILQDYHIAHPLALMVGSRVAGATQQDEATKSDVLRALRFFHRFLRNEEGWSVARLDDLLGSTSAPDLLGLGGALKQAREYFSSVGISDAETLFEFVTSAVFHSAGGGGLVVHRIRGNDNEIALRASEAGGAEPFGLVYIGKASDLTGLIMPEHGIEQSEDALADAWFPRIDEPNSPVQFLIGAKMFIEGWSSWRVSAMGLVNIGKSEGSEIIQLFGRGVRLLGLNRSLKRSGHLPGRTHPPCLPILERLFVFAIDSRYMEKFREIIDREGVDGSGFLEFNVELWRTIDHESLPGLRVPEWPGENVFRERTAVLFKRSHLGNLPSRRRLAVRREARYQAVASDEDIVRSELVLPEKKLSQCPWRSLVDDQALYLRLVGYLRQRGFDNLGFSLTDVRSFLERHADDFVIQAPEEFHRPLCWSDRRRLEDAVFDLLKMALDRVYRRAQQTWETRNMKMPPLHAEHANYRFAYRIRVPQKLAVTAPYFVKNLETLIPQCPKKDWTGIEALAAVTRFGEHLYQPLLVDVSLARNSNVPERTNQLQLTGTPGPLTESEQNFVEMLRDYWRLHKEIEHRNEQIFLLRNLSKGRGVGFFESEGFFPDFILWHVRADGRQRLVFVEPHGMRQDDAPDINNKVRIAHEIGTHLNDPIRAANCPIAEVTAYIVSATPFADLSRKHGAGWTIERYRQHHILFPAEMVSEPYLGGLLSAD